MELREVVVYGVAANGARAASVNPEEGTRVLVQPDAEEQNPRAVELAHQIAYMVGSIAETKAAHAATTEALARARARVSALETINLAATAGRRRFFGPVLMRPAAIGDWSGAVWLLDPEKQERGQGLRFASVAEVRALHPELWVVSADADGVMLDAWGEVSP